MPHLPPEYRTLEIVLYATAAALILFVGYRIGRAFGHLRTSKLIDKKEQELFTTQKGFRTLYEQEIATLKSDKASLDEQVRLLNQRVEEYRKKAAGLGGLFSSSAKKNDAMYALLLENEALEEALYAQNEKLRQERTDGLKEQMRATSYRRVLMSQLLNDERIKQYVNEVLADEKRLPDSHTQTASPQPGQPQVHASDNHH
jgi:predicted lactoylglutathione lyase